MNIFFLKVKKTTKKYEKKTYIIYTYFFTQFLG